MAPPALILLPKNSIDVVSLKVTSLHGRCSDTPDRPGIRARRYGFQNIPVVSLGPWGLTEPPYVLYSVFNPNPPDRYPLRRHRKLGGIVPKELLRQMEAKGIDQLNEKLIDVHRPRRQSFVIASADVEDETAVVFEHACKPLSELDRNQLT